MDTGELFHAQQAFEERLNSLENDSRRAFVATGELRPAPFPIAMYAFATIDYFSSCWAGWNDRTKRPSSDNRNQTNRMADFLEEHLVYPQKESQLAITMWRHKLMHTGEPRLLRDGVALYGWRISDQTPDHWVVKNVAKDEYVLNIGIYDLVRDLRLGVFGPRGYFWNLRADPTLQANYQNFKHEIESYTFSF